MNKNHQASTPKALNGIGEANCISRRAVLLGNSIEHSSLAVNGGRFPAFLWSASMNSHAGI